MGTFVFSSGTKYYLVFASCRRVARYKAQQLAGQDAKIVLLTETFNYESKEFE